MFSHQRRPSFLILAFATSIGTGCGDTVNGGNDEVSGETSEPSEEPCDCVDSDYKSWGCECYKQNGLSYKWVHEGYFCALNESSAIEKCSDHCQYDEPSAIDYDLEGQVACYFEDSSMSCTGWNPAAEIDFNSSNNTYTMDWAFVMGLVADPEPLWGCDDATVRLGEDGFEVANASSGEFLYELGLRNGDVIVSMNGISLDTYADVGGAFSGLLSNGVTEYTLVVDRSSTPTEFNYELFVTSP